jgi:L,D-transpeptidase ErfK/SrfK
LIGTGSACAAAPEASTTLSRDPRTTSGRDPGTILSPPAPAAVKDRPIEERAPRPSDAYTFVVAEIDAGGGESVVGGAQVHVAKAGETFLEISRDYDLGYNEIVAANPRTDPWVAKAGTEILIPSEWILPRGAREGVVVNIPEMRLYYFLPRADGSEAKVLTFPVGLGRQDWQTPEASFKIRGKTRNPTWIIPESIKKERIEKQGFTEEMIPGGSPDNPLGKFRIELTLPMYGIHGSNKEWGVGMQVSHGCIRMFPEDIETLFGKVRIGEPGHFVYEPIKVGMRGGRVLVEVHDDIYGVAPWPWMLAQQIVKDMGLERLVDRDRLEAAVEAASGVPTDVGHVKWPDLDGGTPVQFNGIGDPIVPYAPPAGS